MKTWNFWTWTGCLMLPNQPVSVGFAAPQINPRMQPTHVETPITPTTGNTDLEVGLEVGFNGVSSPPVQLNDPYPFSRN